MRSVIFFFALVAVATNALASPYIFELETDDEVDTQMFMDTYFLKSVSDNKINPEQYPEYMTRLHSMDDIKTLVHDVKGLSVTSNSTCNAAQWLQCGGEVLSCIQPCHEGLQPCLSCLGDSYKDCCGCVRDYVPKIPCPSSSTH